MVFKLAKSAERHWRRLDGSERLAQVIQGVRFRNGEPVKWPRRKPPPEPHPPNLTIAPDRLVPSVHQAIVYLQNWAK